MEEEYGRKCAPIYVSYGATTVEDTTELMWVKREDTTELMWITRKGDTVRIPCMSVNHISNCLRLLCIKCERGGLKLGDAFGQATVREYVRAFVASLHERVSSSSELKHYLDVSIK